MPQILEQTEIDALLAAVDQGAISPEAAETPSAPAKPGHPLRNNQVRPYDFKRPERVSKEQMRSLESLHETFSRGFGASLSGYLRTIVEVNLISIEQMTYGEFLQLLPNPTCMHLLSAKPLEGSLILEVNPLIIFPIIDRLLGGGNEAAFIPDRALTAIETVLVDRIIQRALDCLHEAWMLVKDINFAVAQSESNPAMVQIVPPNEVVVAVGFEIGMGGRSGMMSFCIPYNVIEPIMSEFTGHDWAAYGRGGAVESSRKVVVSRISTSLVNVTAYLAETSISLNDLMALKPGDILRTDKASDGELLITVNRQAKFRGKPGLFKGHKAVELTRFALPQEPV